MTPVERLALMLQGRIEKEGLEHFAKALSVACKERGRYLRVAGTDEGLKKAEAWEDMGVKFAVIAYDSKHYGIHSGVLTPHQENAELSGSLITAG